VAAALAAHGLAHEVRLTTRASEASELARRAADEGARLVVAVGGDGTLHEVVGGLLEGRDRLPPHIGVGLVPAGRGSDYARGLGLPRVPEPIVARFAAWLAGDETAARAVDAGEVTYHATPLVAGRPAPPEAVGPEVPQTRRFINGAGIGFSPYVAQRTHRFPARLGAYLYTAAGLLTIVDWRERGVRIGWDGAGWEERSVESIELALGGYEGGGMHVAPGADPRDGLFDAVIIGATSRWELLTFAWRIRSGDHVRSPRVEVRRTAGMHIEVVDERGPLYLQADGELLGRDPLSLRVLPSALRFVW
jgi:YegS/Rv2252/BmrU family lipid kinase